MTMDLHRPSFKLTEQCAAELAMFDDILFCCSICIYDELQDWDGFAGLIVSVYMTAFDLPYLVYQIYAPQVRL